MAMKDVMKELKGTGTLPRSWPAVGKRCSDAQFHEIEQWYRARRLILGALYRMKQDPESLSRGLEMARPCTHPEAKWVCGVIDANKITANADRRDLVAVFASLGESQGGAALYFLGYAIGKTEHAMTVIGRAATLGYAPAQIWTAINADIPVEAAAALCSKAADQNDPDALYTMAVHYIEDQRERALVYLFNAACAGNPNAQEDVAQLCRRHDIQRFEWFHSAALSGRVSGVYISEITCLHHPWPDAAGTRRKMYALGRLLDGNIDPEKKTLYKVDALSALAFHMMDQLMDTMAQASLCVRTFKFWSSKTRESVDAWTACAIRLDNRAFPGEIRRLVSQYVWASRSDGLYPCGHFVDDEEDEEEQEEESHPHEAKRAKTVK